MNVTSVHADRTRAALVHGHTLPWLPSPEAGVERRLLERVGGEVALATSIVHYQPGCRFAAHAHGLGEEFLVLEGTFCDEHGRYGPGTYVRNPPGTRHAPFSDDGCVIFVKLRQMQPDDRDAACIGVAERHWQPSGLAGIERALLHAGGGSTVQLERLGAGAQRSADAVPGGEELFVVEGSVQRGNDTLQRWGWVRDATPRSAALHSAQGALLWVKRGHLARRGSAETRLA